MGWNGVGWDGWPASLPPPCCPYSLSWLRFQQVRCAEPSSGLRRRMDGLWGRGRSGGGCSSPYAPRPEAQVRWDGMEWDGMGWDGMAAGLPPSLPPSLPPPCCPNSLSWLRSQVCCAKPSSCLRRTMDGLWGRGRSGGLMNVIYATMYMMSNCLDSILLDLRILM